MHLDEGFVERKVGGMYVERQVGHGNGAGCSLVSIKAKSFNLIREIIGSIAFIVNLG